MFKYLGEKLVGTWSAADVQTKNFEIEDFVDLLRRGSTNAANNYLAETDETQKAHKDAYRNLITEWKKHYGIHKVEGEQSRQLPLSIYMKFFQLLLKRQYIQAQQFAITEFQDNEGKTWLPLIEAFKFKNEDRIERIFKYIKQILARNEQEWLLYSQGFSLSDFNQDEKENLKSWSDWKIEFDSLKRYKLESERGVNKEASLACHIVMKILSEFQIEKFDQVSTVKDKQAQYYLSKIASHLKNIYQVDEQLKNLVKIINELKADGCKSTQTEQKQIQSLSKEFNILNSLQSSMLSLNRFVTNSQTKIVPKTDYTPPNRPNQGVSTDLERKVRQLFCCSMSEDSLKVIGKVHDQLKDLRNRVGSIRSFEQQLSQHLQARLGRKDNPNQLLTLSDYENILKKSISSDMQPRISELNNSLRQIYESANQSFQKYRVKHINSVQEIKQLFKILKELLQKPKHTPDQERKDKELNECRQQIRALNLKLVDLGKKENDLKELLEKMKKENVALLKQKQGFKIKCQKVKERIPKILSALKQIKGEKQALTKMVGSVVNPSFDVTPLGFILQKCIERALRQQKARVRNSIQSRLADLRTKQDSLHVYVSQRLSAYRSLIQKEKGGLETICGKLESEIIEYRNKFGKDLESRYLRLFNYNIYLREFDTSRKFLVDCLEETTKQTILYTKLLYRQDPKNMTSFHNYVDKIPHIVCIVKIDGDLLIAAYVQQPLCPEMENGNALIFSLSGGLCFKLKPDRRAAIYDDFYFIVGNADFRLRINEHNAYSNLGTQNSSFDGRGNGVDSLFGFTPREKPRDTTIISVEMYQLLFE